MRSLSALVLMLLLSLATADAQNTVDTAIIDLRLQGNLLEAETAVKRAMAERELPNADALYLHLELATLGNKSDTFGRSMIRRA